MMESPTDTRQETYEGSCFCGAVRITVQGEPAGDCHCASCRSWSAGPVNGFTLWKPEQVKVTQGEAHIAEFHRTCSLDGPRGQAIRRKPPDDAANPRLDSAVGDAFGRVPREHDRILLGPGAGATRAWPPGVRARTAGCPSRTRAMASEPSRRLRAHDRLVCHAAAGCPVS